MKKMVFTMLCLWHGGYLSAQIQETFWHWQAIDTVRVVCTYDYSEYFTFSSEHLKEHEDYLLEIGDSLSRYYSYKYFQKDSLFYTTPVAKQEYQRRVHEGMKAKDDAQESRLSKMLRIMPGGSALQVYKNWPSDSITVLDRWSGLSEYHEPLEPQPWQIQTDTTLILGLRCQKAVCQWRGRDYTAWFTEEIPINDGPYKFFGLPGLIVSVEDATGEYGWYLKGIEQPEDTRIYRYEPLDGKKFKRTDRLTELRKQWKSRLGMVKQLNADAVMLGKGPSETEDPYDLIELDYK